MAANNDVQLAKQTIQSLTSLMNITQIIYVDDYFEARFDVEIIIGWLYNVPENRFAEMAELLPGVNLSSPPEIWTREFRNIWERLTIDAQKEIAVNISSSLGTRFYQDYQVANRLSKYFPRRITLRTLSPSEWIDQRELILNGATPEAKILCMFDQDLSEARGFHDAGPQSGIGLIHEVVNRELHEVVICCLLTHTIPSLENEMPTWRTLAQENELDLFQFLPLAKIRLSDGESPLLFADGIKKSLLNLYCEKWKRAAIQVINNSTEKATSHVMNVDVYDFDHMIFQISMEEGIWELDTLVRLFQIFHRDEIRKLVLDPRITAEFSALIKASRPISAVKIDGKLNHVMSQIRPIRRKELYQDASLVQYTPIDVGDLFFNSNNQKTYILLGQPCDLMVRSVGKRAGKRASDHLLVPLVPLHRISPEDFYNKQINHWKTHASMHYFYPDSNDVAEVVFAEACWVDLNFLDLSILNPDGLCRLDLANLPPIPEICTLGWRIRLEELIHRFSEEYNQLNMIEKHVNRIRNTETKDLIQQALLSSHAFSKGIFDFKLKRICRYRQPAADRMLKMYTQYLSRDADEVDFAKSSQKK